MGVPVADAHSTDHVDLAGAEVQPPVYKQAVYMFFCAEDLQDMAGFGDLVADAFSDREPTPEEALRHTATQAARHTKIESIHQEHAALVSSLIGPARAVAELHAVDYAGTCTGCDIDGIEAERPEWPCSTICVLREPA